MSRKNNPPDKSFYSEEGCGSYKMVGYNLNEKQFQGGVKKIEKIFRTPQPYNRLTVNIDIINQQKLFRLFFKLVKVKFF